MKRNFRFGLGISRRKSSFAQTTPSGAPSRRFGVRSLSSSAAAESKKEQKSQPPDRASSQKREAGKMKSRSAARISKRRSDRRPDCFPKRVICSPRSRERFMLAASWRENRNFSSSPAAISLFARMISLSSPAKPSASRSRPTLIRAASIMSGSRSAPGRWAACAFPSAPGRSNTPPMALIRGCGLGF
ncbi:hypothetical protein BH20VER3_BH20VER3_10730 [soil metagenome]